MKYMQNFEKKLMFSSLKRIHVVCEYRVKSGHCGGRDASECLFGHLWVTEEKLSITLLS